MTSKHPVQANRVWIKIDGTFVAKSEYTYDSQSKVVTLNQSACQKLQNKARNKREFSVSIIAGCPPSCVDAEEICNYRDDDCDGQVDETCPPCDPEVCDGTDDDCDGTIDEGCPG